ncbi:MAG TPA: VOC family protein [Candidatus Dormibacteraeota bacterium]|nr:VOC family protein [Candidatus Dormibacteraeota bacterium]
MRLQDRIVRAVIPAADLDRARAFWEGKLGFVPTRVLETGIFYDCADSSLVLSRSSGAGTSQATVAAFVSDDLEADVAALKSMGITFEEYDYPTLKTVGSMAWVGPVHAAWFKDSEGNIIGIAQYPG